MKQKNTTQLISYQYRNISFFTSLSLLFLIMTSSCNKSKKDAITKDYRQLHTLYSKATSIKEKLNYCTIFLKKAKQEENAKMILAGYRMFSVTHTDENVLVYSDSIIALTKGNSTKHYPAIAFEKKGDFYYHKRAYKHALDNYVQFAQYARKHQQQEMVSNANYNIGVIKRRTGNYKEALALYHDNYTYIKQHRDSVTIRTYLNSITAIANVYNDMGIGDSASYFNKLGYKEAIRLKNERFQYHFALNQGISEYHKQRFKIAIDSIEKYIPHFENLNDYDKLSFAYYYIGETYWELGKKEKAMRYFKKVDTTFQKTNSLFPLLQKAYIRLDTYYKEQDDMEQQNHNLNRYITVDSVINSGDLYLSKVIYRDYEIPKLHAEKKIILSEKQQQQNRFKKIVIALVILVFLVLIGFSVQYKKRKTAQRRFQEVIKSKKSNGTKNKPQETAKTLAIPSEIIEEIVSKLDVFEKENGFISNEITLNFLAKELNTNPNYLSKIVNHVKQCSFSNYINNLRVEYAIEQLKSNPTYIKYTIKAIASEVGFNNVQSFSKAFSNSKGINPSYFIRELKKATKL